MATVIPDPIGESAEQTTRNILNALLTSRQLDISARQATVAERRQALDELEAMLSLGPSGVPIAEMPFAHGPLQRIAPNLDPTDPEGLGGVVARPETFRSAVDRYGLEALASLDPEQRERLFDESVDRAVMANLTGQAMSEEESRLMSERAEAAIAALENFEPRAEDLEDMALTELGLEPRTRVVDPNTGEVAEFTTSNSAALSVDLLKHYSQQNFLDRQAQLEAAMQDESVERFVELAQEANIAISDATARQIISVVHEGEEDQLQEFVEAHQENPAVIGALQLYTNGAYIAEEAIYDWFRRQGPGGEQFANTIRILGSLSDELGQEETSRIYRLLIHQFHEQGWDVTGRPGGVAAGTRSLVSALTGRLFDPPAPFTPDPDSNIEGEAQGPRFEPSPELLDAFGIEDPGDLRPIPGASVSGVPGAGAMDALNASLEQAVRLSDALTRVESGDVTLTQLSREGFTSQEIQLLRSALEDLEEIPENE